MGFFTKPVLLQKAWFALQNLLYCRTILRVTKETCCGFALHRCRLFSKEASLCGGALRALKKFRVGAILAIVTALNFFNGVNCSLKAESPTP